MAFPKNERPKHLVWLVAMDCVTRNILALGRWRVDLGAALFRSRDCARIFSALWRSRRARAPGPLLPVLSAAFAAQISSLERVDDRNGNFRSSVAAMENSRCVPRDVAGNILAALLEFWRPDRDVDNSIQTRGSDFSGDSAALSITWRANGSDFGAEQRTNTRFSMAGSGADYRVSAHDWLQRFQNCNGVP